MLAIWAGVALTPAMIAVGSPGASRSSRKALTATSVITTATDARRRRAYAIIGRVRYADTRSVVPPSRFLDVPERNHQLAHTQHTLHVRAPCGGPQVLAHIDMGHEIPGILLNLFGHSELVLGIRPCPL